MKTVVKILLLVIMALHIAAVCYSQTLKAFPFPNGTEYPYMELKPDSAKAILFFVHGHGERGNGSYDFATGNGELNRVKNIGIPKLIAQGKWTRKDFIVIAPQYKVTVAHLYPPTFHSFVKKMCAKHNIDSTNVYMVGISGGGISVWNYITKYSHVKAALPIAGIAPVSLANKALNTKIWVVQGEDDTICPISSVQQFVDKYNALNPKVKAKIDRIPNYAHEAGVWDRACSKDKYFAWMLQP